MTADEETRIIGKVLAETKSLLEQAGTGHQWITIKDAAQRTSLSYSTVYDAIYRGDLMATKKGRALRISLADLEAWMSKDRVRAPRLTRSETDALVARHLPALVG